MSNSEIAMVMPMAGRGSRFARGGAARPKPLIDLHGRPFFWWAHESLCNRARVVEAVFVVLDEHCRAFGLDRQILDLFPDAKIVRLDAVTSGAAETAAIGLEALSWRGPVAVNDCDHAFDVGDFDALSAAIANGADGALLGFKAREPVYSYVRFDADGAVAGTAEKVVVSDQAIAGCYLFSSPQVFARALGEYRLDCDYAELFVSGLYNSIIRRGGRVAFQELARHVSFGVPEEQARVSRRDLEFLLECQR